MSKAEKIAIILFLSIGFLSGFILGIYIGPAKIRITYNDIPDIKTEKLVGGEIIQDGSRTYLYKDNTKEIILLDTLTAKP